MAASVMVGSANAGNSPSSSATNRANCGGCRHPGRRRDSAGVSVTLASKVRRAWFYGNDGGEALLRLARIQAEEQPRAMASLTAAIFASGGRLARKASRLSSEASEPLNTLW